MNYRILKEQPNPDYVDGAPDAQRTVFVPTGETFVGEGEEAAAYVEALKAETGVCHAAELVA